MTSVAFADVEVVAFDIDGTLTDGTTTYLGPDHGWSQTYSTRDGEAILHMVATGLVVLPLSRNRTDTARARMEGLKLPLDFLGVDDKTCRARCASLAHRSVARSCALRR